MERGQAARKGRPFRVRLLVIKSRRQAVANLCGTQGRWYGSNALLAAGEWQVTVLCRKTGIAALHTRIIASSADFSSLQRLLKTFAVGSMLITISCTCNRSGRQRH